MSSEPAPRPTLRRNVVSGTLIAMMFGLSAWAWPRVPDRIPVHFDFAGNVDRYGGRVEGLLVVPLLCLALWGLFLLLPKIDPARRDYSAFAGAWTLVQVSLFGFFTFLQVTMVGSALGIHLDVSRAITLGTAVLFIVLGSALGRLKRNWFAGVRTPWTLSSERSWVATHRLAGKLFVAVGLLTLPASLVSNAAGLGVLLGGLGAASLVAVVYSYKVWRDDPDRTPRE